MPSPTIRTGTAVIIGLFENCISDPKPNIQRMAMERPERFRSTSVTFLYMIPSIITIRTKAPGRSIIMESWLASFIRSFIRTFPSGRMESAPAPSYPRHASVRSLSTLLKSSIVASSLELNEGSRYTIIMHASADTTPERGSKSFVKKNSIV